MNKAAIYLASINMLLGRVFIFVPLHCHYTLLEKDKRKTHVGVGGLLDCLSRYHTCMHMLWFNLFLAVFVSIFVYFWSKHYTFHTVCTCTSFDIEMLLIGGWGNTIPLFIYLYWETTSHLSFLFSVLLYLTFLLHAVRQYFTFEYPPSCAHLVVYLCIIY